MTYSLTQQFSKCGLRSPGGGGFWDFFKRFTSSKLFHNSSETLFALFIPPTSSWRPILYFLCLHLSIWDSSYKWNCVLRGLLCLRLSLSKMFWRLIQVVAHEYLFLFLAEEHCYLWVVSTFWILGIKLMWTYTGSCMNMCFPQQLHHCTFWPACLRVPFFFTFLPTLIIFCHFYYSHPVGMKSISEWKSTICWCLYDLY